SHLRKQHFRGSGHHAGMVARFRQPEPDHPHGHGRARPDERHGYGRSDRIGAGLVSGPGGGVRTTHHEAVPEEAVAASPWGEPPDAGTGGGRRRRAARRPQSPNRLQAHFWISITTRMLSASGTSISQVSRETGAVPRRFCPNGRYIMARWSRKAPIVVNTRNGLRSGDILKAEMVSERQFPICTFSKSTMKSSRVLRASDTSNPASSIHLNSPNPRTPMVM